MEEIRTGGVWLHLPSQDHGVELQDLVLDVSQFALLYVLPEDAERGTVVKPPYSRVSTTSTLSLHVCVCGSTEVPPTVQKHDWSLQSAGRASSRTCDSH